MERIHSFTHRLFVKKTNNIAVQFIRYGMVLFIAAPLDLGGYILLIHLHVPAVPASIIAFLVSLTVNYILSITWAFNADPKKKEALKISIFFTIGLIGLALTALVIAICVHVLGIDEIVSKLIALCIVFFWNFLARRALLTQR